MSSMIFDKNIDIEEVLKRVNEKVRIGESISNIKGPFLFDPECSRVGIFQH